MLLVGYTKSAYAAQAVVALEGTAGAEATSLADLQGLRLGAQTGTTSLTAIRDVIQPEADPLVFEALPGAVALSVGAEVRVEDDRFAISGRPHTLRGVPEGGAAGRARRQAR